MLYVLRNRISKNLLKYDRFSTSINSSSSETPTYDVIIVGAGIVGASLALRLANSVTLKGMRVAVLEPKPPLSNTKTISNSSTPPDLRTFAITPASQRLLEQIGAWKLLPQTPSFDSMQVWDSLGPGYVRFNAHESRALNTLPLGWIIESTSLQNALFDQLQELDNKRKSGGEILGADITLFSPDSVIEASFPPPADEDEAAVPLAARGTFGVGGGGPPSSRSTLIIPPQSLASISLASGMKVKARLVVAADGSNSQIRSWAGIGTSGWEYDQRAVVATIETESPHSTAWQRFLPHGPVAILPLHNRYSSVVWSTTPTHAQYLMSLPREGFVSALNAVLNAHHNVFKAALRGDAAAEEEASKNKTKAMSDSMTLSNSSSSSQSSQSTSSSSSNINSSDEHSAASTQGAYKRSTDTLPLDPLTATAKILENLSMTLFEKTPGGSPRFEAPPRVTAVVSGGGVGGSGRASFPLQLSQANRYVRPRLALIGDAAHSVHPLAGQGLNLGLADAEDLAKVMEASSRVGGDPGALRFLQQYASRRQAQTVRMMVVLESIKQIFALPVSVGGAGADVHPIVHLTSPIVIAVRSLGMLALNAARPITNMIAKFVGQ
jgi:ubiquinone biosynthesis UbiH/UbiF/VisC/COQ6 family hydroxylase